MDALTNLGVTILPVESTQELPLPQGTDQPNEVPEPPVREERPTFFTILLRALAAWPA